MWGVGLMKTQGSGSNILLLIKKIGIAVLITGTAILFSACGKNDIAKIKAFSSSENLPIQEATNFQTISSDSGQVRYSLKAPKLLRYETEGVSYVEFPLGVNIVKYDADKNIISTLRADYAKQFAKDKHWEAKNNVVVTNAQGDSLKTEHLILDEKTEKIETEEFVKIIRKDQVITGIGLTSDQDMRNWKIKNPKGVLYVSVNNKKDQTQEKEDGQEEGNAPKPQETDNKVQFR